MDEFSRDMFVGADPYSDLLFEMGAEPQPAPRQAPPPALPPPQQQQQAHPQPYYGPPPAPQASPYGYAPPPSPYGYPRQHQHHQMQQHQHMQQHPSERRKFRHFPIGFVRAGIAPGEIADIEVKPQVKFRGERLAVDTSNARQFALLDIKVGKDSQLAATGEMPAEAFSSQSVGTRMELDTAEPGIVIVLRIRNKGSTTEDFSAVLYGTVIERD